MGIRDGGRRWVALALLVGGAAACEDSGVDEAVPVRVDADTVVSEAPAVSARLATVMPPGTSLEIAEEGRRLFPTCGVCHGLQAEGTALGPSLRDTLWIHGSGDLPEIIDLIREGVPGPEQFPIPMPPLGGGDFSADQVRALAAYVYALSHDPQNARSTP